MIPENGRWTRSKDVGETQHATLSIGSPTGTAPPSAHRATLTSNWLSASLRHSTVTPRVPILRRVRLAAARNAPVPLGPDDWWPAWHDPSPDAWSTDYDSLAETSDDGSLSAAMTTLTRSIGPSGPSFLPL